MNPIEPADNDPEAPSTTSAPLPTTGDMPNGLEALTRVIRDAGYSSVLDAVARQVIFLHPDTVAQTALQPVFPVIRSMAKRGTTTVLPSGQEVMYDDNRSPTEAFKWAAGWTKKPMHLQFNHVITDSSDPKSYTALWNLCVTPTYLAKLTDAAPEVQAALRYRSHELYGTPAHLDAPTKPDGYDALVWAPVTEPINDLATEMRKRLAKTNEKRMNVIKRLGWLFGDPIQS
jgi:hypothetical protein